LLVSEVASKTTQEGVKIGAVYPNPISQTANIQVNSIGNKTISLALFDLMGRKVAELYRGNLTVGENQITFDIPSSIKKGLYQLVSTVNGIPSAQTIAIGQ